MLVRTISQRMSLGQWCCFRHSHASRHRKISGPPLQALLLHAQEIALYWRLQRAGYRIGYESTSLVYHADGVSLAQSHPQKAFYRFRNNLFFSRRICILLSF